MDACEQRLTVTFGVSWAQHHVMHLVILHYHLNRGGVTRVIENQLRSLASVATDQRPRSVTILHGGRSDAWNVELADQLPFPLSTVAIPQLDYDDVSGAARASNDQADRTPLLPCLQRALLDAGCRPEATVLHVHNHNLGKNWGLPGALYELSRNGWHTLFQIHDFAEDLRPLNYRHMLLHASSPARLQEQLYPQAGHLHYAVLNSRDRQVLMNAGFDKSRVHSLPNPVLTSVAPLDREVARNMLRQEYHVPVDRPYVLYPVRAIRRKNIGEVLLWSAVLSEVTFAITLAPLDAQERNAYERWVTLADELSLPVLFDVGASGRMSFEAHYAAADAIITTSVAEGFGLVFLESYLSNRPLFGRDLPVVTDDFRSLGMEFPGLVSSLRIVASSLNLEQLHQTYVQMTRDLRGSFGLDNADSESFKHKIRELFQAETIDFARLDRASQQMVIRQAAGDRDFRGQLIEANPCFGLMTNHFQDPARMRLETNRTVIQSDYSLEISGQRYAEICQRVLQSPATEVTVDARHGQSILEQFLTPDCLYPIRLEA